MERSPFLPLPEGLVIGQVEISEAQLTMEVISTQPFACCPGCGSPSDHIHCQYQRTDRDAPCGGRLITSWKAQQASYSSVYAVITGLPTCGKNAQKTHGRSLVATSV